MTKDRFVEILHEIRKKRVCAYIGYICDCKFGATHINNPTYEDNGCPELYLAAAMISSMTEDEWNSFCNRTGIIFQ